MAFYTRGFVNIGELNDSAGGQEIMLTIVMDVEKTSLLVHPHDVVSLRYISTNKVKAYQKLDHSHQCLALVRHLDSKYRRLFPNQCKHATYLQVKVIRFSSNQLIIQSFVLFQQA